MRYANPFLLAVVLVVLGACAGTPSLFSPGGHDRALERQALDLVNQARAEHGLPPMRRDPVLSRAAQSHANDMQSRGYYGHNSPSGRNARDRHDRAGGSRWRAVAENIARCTRCGGNPEEVDLQHFHRGWMNSPGHRANILSPHLDSFGFGVARDGDGMYLVQNFAGPGLPNAYRDGDDLTPLGPDAQARAALERLNAARADAGVPALALGDELSRAVEAALPRPEDEHFDVRSTAEIARAVPRLRIATLYGACGACGAAPVAADIRFFLGEWLDRPRYRDRLLDPAATHFGFGLAANAQGRKVALAATAR